MTSTKPGVHEICDRYVDDYAAAHPLAATFMGVAGHDTEMTDLSPEGHSARVELARRSLSAARAAEPADTDEATARAMFTERLERELDLADAGRLLGELNVIDSPVQHVRMVFDVMPRETPEHWADIVARAEQVPQALTGARASLLAAADNGVVSALRQVAKVAEQAEIWAGLKEQTGFFRTLAEDAAVPESLREPLAEAGRAAEESFAEFAGFLRAELAPRAPVRDAVGVEVYRPWSRYFLGADVDPVEAYEWGWAEFGRIEREMVEVAGRIRPGASLAETAAALDSDERYRVHGRDAFQRWMQQLSDGALEALRGKHFDIPEQLNALECRIAPPGGGVGAYYTGPDEDFTRPGRMWWSLPADRDSFSTWREATIVYHEGAPGHHLQVATAMAQADRLNRYQRIMGFTSGHGEGWALYAERLVQELGFLDDGYLFGMLDSQMFRAARVIVDTGMHLELPIPAGTGFHERERWTPELGLEFLLTRTVSDPAHCADEIDRYLGWPGQAPSYKLGERLWLTARDEARARAGASFDLKDFHTRALNLGGMGLDILRERLAALD